MAVDLPADALDKILTAIEKRLPFGPRIVQIVLAAGVLAFLAFCAGVIAPFVQPILQKAPFVASLMPGLDPTAVRVIGGVFVVGLFILFEWRLNRLVRRLREATELSVSKMLQGKRLITELEERSSVAKTEGDRLVALLQDQPAQPTFATTVKPKTEPTRIPTGEFTVSAQAKKGALYIRVENCKSVAKTGHEICVTDMLWYSSTLEGTGGFAQWPWFKGLTVSKCLPSLGKGELNHGFPHAFELLRPADSDGWRFALSGQATILKTPRWRFVLELRWNKQYHPLLAEVLLKVVDGQPSADLSLYEGDDALRRVMAPFDGAQS